MWDSLQSPAAHILTLLLWEMLLVQPAPGLPTEQHIILLCGLKTLSEIQSLLLRRLPWLPWQLRRQHLLRLPPVEAAEAVVAEAAAELSRRRFHRRQKLF